MEKYLSSMRATDIKAALARWRRALEWWRTNRPDHPYAVESLTAAIEAAELRLLELANPACGSLVKLANLRDQREWADTSPPRPWPYDSSVADTQEKVLPMLAIIITIIILAGFVVSVVMMTRQNLAAKRIRGEAALRGQHLTRRDAKLAAREQRRHRGQNVTEAQRRAYYGEDQDRTGR